MDISRAMKAIAGTGIRSVSKWVFAWLALGWLLAAGTGRAADSTNAVAPVDLAGKYAVTASSLTNAGWPAWKSCPLGHQVFRNVPFEIGGAIYLWGYGRNTNQSSPHPERVGGIEVNRVFATLYALHGSYFMSPENTPVVQVAFRYADGSAATNTLRFGADMLTWPISLEEGPLQTPYSTNSEIAWMGGEFSPSYKSRLRYCMTALANPYPDRPVATLDLISCKTRTIPYIFALTTGPAGLMRTGPRGWLKEQGEVDQSAAVMKGGSETFRSSQPVGHLP